MVKQYYKKEIKCPFCHKKSKPILEKNTINPGIGSWAGGRLGRIGSGLTEEKEHQLVCPHCKAIIGFI
jgi:Zn finger protein HypA/HybF involved in hydrogenase expression